MNYGTRIIIIKKKIEKRHAKGLNVLKIYRLRQINTKKLPRKQDRQKTVLDINYT